jgi:DNA-binding transcriptional MerR regulator
VNSAELASAAGISYRQLDTWTTRRYLRPDRPAAGTGTVRVWTADEAAVARRMAGLVRAGFTVEAAARLARYPAGAVELAPGVTVVIDGEAP